MSIELCLYRESLGGSIERLLEGTVDIAITENLVNLHTIEARPFFDVDLMPVCTPELFSKNSEYFASVDNLYLIRQIILRDSSQRSDKYTFGVVESTRNWSVSDLDLKKQLICDGIGWGRLPRDLIEKEIYDESLMQLDYPHIQSKTVTMSLLRRTDKEYGPIAKQLMKIIKSIPRFSWVEDPKAVSQAINQFVLWL